MQNLALVGLWLVIFGLLGYAGRLLRRAIRLYRQRPDLHRALWPLIVNLSEPYISLLYWIPAMLWWDYSYLLGLIEHNFAAGSIALAYHWPMHVLLIYVPFMGMFAQKKIVAQTAWLCFATGLVRMTMLWLSFNYFLGGGMVVLALILAGGTFWLLGRYLNWLALPLPQRPVEINIDEQGLVLIQPIEPNKALDEPNQHHSAQL